MNELKINLLKSKYLTLIFILQISVVLSLFGVLFVNMTMYFQANKSFYDIFKDDNVYNIMDVGGSEIYSQVMNLDNIENIDNLYTYLDNNYIRIQQIQNQFNNEYDTNKLRFMSVNKDEAERFKEQGFAPYLSLRVNDNFFLKYDVHINEGTNFNNFKYELNDKVPLILGDAYREYYKVGDDFGGDYFLFPEDTTYEVVGFIKKGDKYYNLNLGTYISLDHYILLPDVDIDVNNAYRKEVIIANFAQRIPGLLLSDEDTYLDLKDKVNELDMSMMYRIDNQRNVVDSIYGDAINSFKMMAISFGTLTLFSLLIIIMNLFRRISMNFKRYAVHLVNGASKKDIRKLVMNDLLVLITISTLIAYLFDFIVCVLNPTFFKSYMTYFPIVLIMTIFVDLIIYFVVYIVIRIRLNNIKIIDFIRRLQP